MNNFTSEVTDDANNINNNGTETLDNAESGLNKIEHGIIKNYVDNLKKEYKELINKLF